MSKTFVARGKTAIAATAVSVALVSIGALASPAPAVVTTSPTCPSAVIPGVAIIPNAVGCWNAIGVQAVRISAPYQGQGLLYMSYVQAAVYDAITKIKGRYVPYDAFTVPSGVNVAAASPDAAAAAAAYTMLSSTFMGLSGAATIGLSTTYNDYITALGGMGAAGVSDGVAIGLASATDLIHDRSTPTLDRNESITFTPGPLTPGGWTFAPSPSLQSAQLPWLAVMRPLMIESPSQFRPGPPPALSSDEWAQEFNEVKAKGDVNAPLSVRSAAETAIAKFWNANAVNQSNQGFQDAAIGHAMDIVDAARMLAMGNMVDADSAIACFDAKYDYLFWRPVMAIRNAGIDGNDATVAVPNWTPVLTTPNHPEYPAAHGCLTGAEAEMYSVALDTNRIDVTIRGSANGNANNWDTATTYEKVNDLQREIVNARVWAGLHYRESGVEGVVIGRKVAHWTLKRYFLPAP
jgi:hypothetical protein